MFSIYNKKINGIKKKYQERLTSPCIHMRSSILTILNTSETNLQKNICFVKYRLFLFKDLYDQKIKNKELLSNKSWVITISSYTSSCIFTGDTLYMYLNIKFKKFPKNVETTQKAYKENDMNKLLNTWLP